MSGVGLYYHRSPINKTITVACFPKKDDNNYGVIVLQVDTTGTFDRHPGAIVPDFRSRNDDLWHFLGDFSKFEIAPKTLRSLDEVFITICALYFDDPDCTVIDAWLDSTEEVVPTAFSLRFDWLHDLTAQQLRTSLLEEYDRALKHIKQEGLGYEKPLSE